MFRADHNYVPTSDIRHVTGENMGFALLLRKPMPAMTTTKSKNSKSGAEEGSLEHKIEQAAAFLRRNSAENNSTSRPTSSRVNREEEFKVPKDNGCRNSKCRENAQEMITAAEERVNMKIYFKDLTLSVNDETTTLDTLTQEHDHFMAIQQAMTLNLSKLDVDVDSAKQRMAKKKEEQRQLEEAIAMANQTIRNLLHQQDLKALHIKPQPSKSASNKFSRKHNGEYSMLYSGKLQWSCCHATEENAMGCIDDYSVGLLSTMGRIKSSFCNYSKSQPFVPIHRDKNGLRNKQQEAIKSHQKIVFGSSGNEEQHPLADFHHVGTHVPMESSMTTATLSRPKSAINTSNRSLSAASATLRPLHQRPQSAAPGLPRHHYHQNHHSHHGHFEASSSIGRHRRAHSGHHHHHQHHHNHHHYFNQSESLDQLQTSSILSNFHNSNIGKMRLQREGGSLLLSRNRPMSSPAGFALYKQPVQLHQQHLEASVTFADI